MPKLPSLSAKFVIKIVISHGFVLDRTSGSHYLFFHPITKQRVTIPVHSKNLSKGTLFSILKQAGISKEDLK
jgi:predicted RNA binding protein YcfA (HicA-like mRNA interferase family)